jgi:hypothetical protein
MTTKAPEEKPAAAFVLSLLAGLWMLAMGSWTMGWSPNGAWGADGWGMGGMMGGGWMWGHGVLGVWWPWFGLIAGVVVLVGAAMMYARPHSAPTWGVAIVIVSALNFLLGMGGFLASVLGIIGGALAMSWRPQPGA